MSLFVPTSHVNVFDDTTVTDAYDDLTDAGQLVAQNVPAHVTQHSRRTWNPVDGRTGTVRYQKILLPSGTPVTHNSTLEDVNTGITYHVDHVYEPANFATPYDLRVETTQVGES